MKTIAVYYIATNVYCEMFEGFLNSLKFFMPTYKKVVVLLTDELEEYTNYVDNENNISVDRRHINHYPWPIITLYKHYHILTNRIDCDYAVYFNADIICNEEFKYTDNTFDMDKMNFSSHANVRYKDSTIREHAFIYQHPNSINSIYHYVLDECPEETYCQAAFFFGPSELFFEMCKDIFEYVDCDLRGNYVYMKWHDESYMNVWIQLHKSLSNIIPEFMAAYSYFHPLIKTNRKKIQK